MPELMLAVFCLLIILLDLLPSLSIKRLLPYLTLLGLGGVLAVQLNEGLGNSTANLSQPFFLGLLLKDGLARYAGVLFSLAGIFTVLVSFGYRSFKTAQFGRGEYYGYIVVLVLGLNLMVKAANLLLLFVSIELVSIAGYLLTMIIKGHVRSIEAGLKYILYGALAAGVMLYGMSLLYGFTGSLQFLQPAFWQALTLVYPPAVTVALVLTFAGFLFKLAAAPFHFWAPDVYENTPTPVVALFSTAPKMAGIIVVLRFVHAWPAPANQALYFDALLFVAGIAVFSLIIGNFTALWQSRPKRLLAYSSVSHAGFMLAACVAVAGDPGSTVLFYLTVLLFANFGILFLVQEFEDCLGVVTLPEYSGRGQQFPFLGVLAVIFLVSLTGLPPTAGFTAKLLVFSAVWQTYQAAGHPIMLILLVAGLLFTGVAFFYYVKIPYYLFFKRNTVRPSQNIPLASQILLALLALPLLLFFLRADLLLDVINRFIK